MAAADTSTSYGRTLLQKQLAGATLLGCIILKSFSR